MFVRTSVRICAHHTKATRTLGYACRLDFKLLLYPFTTISFKFFENLPYAPSSVTSLCHLCAHDICPIKHKHSNSPAQPNQPYSNSNRLTHDLPRSLAPSVHLRQPKTTQNQNPQSLSMTMSMSMSSLRREHDDHFSFSPAHTNR